MFLIARHSHLNWALIDQIIVSGINFTIGIILARFLGLAEFGVFSLGIMVTLLVNVIQMGLIMSPMMTIGPKKKYGVTSYYSYALVVQIIFNVILLCVFIAALHLMNEIFPDLNIGRLIYPLATMSAFFLIQDFLRRYYFSISKANFVVVLDVLSYGGQIALIFILLAYSKLVIENVFWAMAFASFLSVVYGLVKYKVRLGKGGVRASRLNLVVRKHWKFGSWIVGGSVFQWVGSQGIIFCAGWILGTSAVGAIRAVINLMAPVNVLIQALYNFLPSKTSQLYKEVGVKPLISYLVQSSVIVVAIVAVVGLIVSVFSSNIMFYLYGEEYVSLSNLVVWQAIYICITSSLISFNIFYRTIHETKVLLKVPLIAAPISILSFVIASCWFQEESVFIGLIANTICMFFLYLNSYLAREYE